MVTESGLQRVDSKGFRENVTKDKPTSRAVSIPLMRVVAKPEETVLLISNQGRLWQGNAGRLPLAGTFAEIGLNRGENLVGLGVAREGSRLILVTTSGQIKRVEMADVLATRAEATWGAIIGLNGNNEQLLAAAVASDEAHVLIGSAGSEKLTPRVLRFESGSINPQATPSAKGVSAIKMLGDPLVTAVVLEPAQFKAAYVIAVTQKGYIKRITLADFPLQGRGGQGVQLWKLTPETGAVVGLAIGSEKDQVDIYSEKMKRLRMDIKALPNVTRATKGQDLGAKLVKGDLFGEGDSTAGVVIC